jgi:chlorobactene glucosyltransferase
MTGTQVGLLVAYAIVIAVWPIRLIVLEIILRHQEVLTPRSPRYDRPDPPLVTAILPAKDEEAYLAECLMSLRRLTYPNLEILVVDDRSTDRTGDIAREIAAADPRVRVLTIDELPPGWTGKTHALERASHAANGQWLLFLDADTLHSPESLEIVMEFARSHGAFLASLLPELRCDTFWERVVQPVAAITLMQSFPLHTVNDDRSPLAFANGQYILNGWPTMPRGAIRASVTGSSRILRLRIE